MSELERIDAADRIDGTLRSKRLRQIPPEPGKFLALLLACVPDGPCIEIGTSGGYSSLWLALACRATSRRLTIFEFDEAKSAIAAETFRTAAVEDVVTLVPDDALDHIGGLDAIGFCFLDAEKEDYQACYDAVVPKLMPGGLLVADNAISHASDLAPVIGRALDDERVDAMVVPSGKGELVCRRADSASLR